MPLRCTSDYSSRLPNGAQVGFATGAIVNGEPELLEFLMRDAPACFEWVDDDGNATEPTSPSEGDAAAAANTAPDTSADPRAARERELSGWNKKQLLDHIAQEWQGLEGVTTKSTNAELVAAILAEEFKAPALGNPHEVTTSGGDADGWTDAGVLAVGYADDGTTVTVPIQTREGEEGVETRIVEDDLSDAQADALAIYATDVEGLERVTVDEEAGTVALHGGAADGLGFLLALVHEDTLAAWARAINPELPLDDLDRAGLVATLRELGEEEA